MDARAGAMEIASQSRDARAEEAALPRLNLQYFVPVDPMDDLQCDSCQ
jgi:hypothetical protein